MFEAGVILPGPPPNPAVFLPLYDCVDPFREDLEKRMELPIFPERAAWVQPEALTSSTAQRPEDTGGSNYYPEFIKHTKQHEFSISNMSDFQPETCSCLTPSAIRAPGG